MRKAVAFAVLALTCIAALLFLGSCVIALSDGQGAFVFIFSIPAMVLLLLAAILLSRKLVPPVCMGIRIDYFPKIISLCLAAFFIAALVPGLRVVPDAFMGALEKAFAQVVGETPYAFFKNRASFPNKLSKELQNKKDIIFSDIPVTYAWDKVCIFGPYTNNNMARSVLKMDWDIEEHSQIHYSDSINALVFFYEGRVNTTVDLSRGIADFKPLDTCLAREQANFVVTTDLNGLTVLEHKATAR